MVYFCIVSFCVVCYLYYIYYLIVSNHFVSYRIISFYIVAPLLSGKVQEKESQRTAQNIFLLGSSHLFANIGFLFNKSWTNVASVMMLLLLLTSLKLFFI